VKLFALLPLITKALGNIGSFRITASKFRQVLHSNLVSSSISLLKQVCYSVAFIQFTNEATRYFIQLLKTISAANTFFFGFVTQSGHKNECIVMKTFK
jgi:hypothetical protein